jgi:hypothetical protein
MSKRNDAADDGPQFVSVSQYERGNGIKVGEHKRAHPAAPEKAEAPPAAVAADDGGDDKKSAKEKKKQDFFASKNKSKKQPRQDDEDADIFDDEADPAAAAADDTKKAKTDAGEAKQRAMTVQEYLSLDLKQMQESAIKQKVGNDPTLNEMVSKDANARIAKEQQDAANTAWAEKGVAESNNTPPGPAATVRPGFKELDDDIVRACSETGWNDNARSVVRNMRAHRYFEDGEFGLRSIVPHLVSAGLFSIAENVKTGGYDLKG